MLKGLFSTIYIKRYHCFKAVTANFWRQVAEANFSWNGNHKVGWGYFIMVGESKIKVGNVQWQYLHGLWKCIKDTKTEEKSGLWATGVESWEVSESTSYGKWTSEGSKGTKEVIDGKKGLSHLYNATQVKATWGISSHSEAPGQWEEDSTFMQKEIRAGGPSLPLTAWALCPKSVNSPP